MIAINPDEIELADNWYEDDDAVQWRDSFPFTPRLGGTAEAENLTVVYFELDEGKQLGTHTDSEEMLFVHEGTVEATIEDEVRRIEEGGMILVPPGKLHSVQDVGNGVARVVGCFPGMNVTSTFEQAVQPFGQCVFGPEASE